MRTFVVLIAAAIATSAVALAQRGAIAESPIAQQIPNRTITAADLVDGVIKLAAGKKMIVLVKPV